MEAVHPAQRGVVKGRHMVSDSIEARATVEWANMIGTRRAGVALCDGAAAFPLVGWEWIWASLRAMCVLAWMVAAMQALYVDSTASVVFGGMVHDGLEKQAGVCRERLGMGAAFRLRSAPANVIPAGLWVLIDLLCR